jgi:hypothetical protein
MQGIVEWQHEHRTSQPELPGARGGIGERLERRNAAGRAEDLLLRPRALEHPQLLDAAQESAESVAVKAAVARVLGD